MNSVENVLRACKVGNYMIAYKYGLYSAKDVPSLGKLHTEQLSNTISPNLDLMNLVDEIPDEWIKEQSKSHFGFCAI